MAQTSDRLSAIAAAYLNTTPADIERAGSSPRLSDKVAADIRSLSASVLRQDEVRGLRKLVSKVLGR